MIDFKSEYTGQMSLIEREEIDDDEDLFEAADKLSSHGINARMIQTKKHLTCINGLSEANVDKICEAAEKPARKSVVRITTGSQALDELPGGGFETMCITEAFGELRSGKTQLAHTLCVSTQLPVNVRVAFIHTKGTFRPDRIVPIAEKFGTNPGAVLDNVRAQSILVDEDLFEAINKLSSHGNNAGDVNKLQDSSIYTWNGPLMQTKKLPVNVRVAFIHPEGTFRPDRIVPIAEKFGINPGAVLDNVRAKSILVDEDLFEAINKLSSHGNNAGDENKLQDASIYTWNGPLMQTKKNLGYLSASDILLKGRDPDSVFSIACSEQYLKMEQLKTACPACIPINMSWKCKDKPMNDPIEMELFRRGDDNMEEYDDDLSDGPEEDDDNWNISNDEAFSRGGEYDFSEKWEQQGYPIVCSKTRESTVVSLYFTGTGEVEDIDFEDLVDCTLLASTCTGWLLFLKGDGQNFFYFNACIDCEYNLPPLPTAATGNGSLIGQWKADIYQEPGMRNHRVILIAQIQSEGGKQLTILTNGGRGWVERTCSVPIEDSPITAGPILCTYQKNDDRLKYGLIWLQGSNQVLACHYDTMDMYVGILEEDLDSNMGMASTPFYTDNCLFLYQQSGGIGGPNVIAICVDDIFVENQIVRAPALLKLPLELFMVQSRRGWACQKRRIRAEDEGGMEKYDLYFVSKCGNHLCTFTRRESTAQWINYWPCEGCEHEFALFLRSSSAIQEGRDATG